MTAMCGTRGSTLLVLSVIYEAGGIGVRRADGMVVSPAAVGTPIYEGDEVFTTTGSGTILFPDDTIVRLDSATQLTLTSGTGVHLDGGSLWARVLGDGDYSIGTDDLAVGVRGTSLYLSRVAPAPTTALVLDSQGGDMTAAATLTCKTDAGTAQTQKSLSTQQIITATAAGCAATSISTKLSKDAFSVYPFVRRSQRADLVYLARLRDGKYTDLRCDQLRYVGLTTGSAVTSPNLTTPFSTLCSPRTTEKLAKVSTEYDVSKPKNVDEQSKLCDTTGQAWWESLEKCVESGVVAVADYTNGDGKMYFKDGTSIAPTNFAQPLVTGKYIEYPNSILSSKVGGLAGKRVEITVDGTIRDNGAIVAF